MKPYLDFSDFFETYKTAAFDKNVDSMMSIYGDDIIAFDMWEAWSLTGEASWRKMNQQWLESLGSESVLVEFDDVVTHCGPEVATAYASIRYSAVSKDGQVLRSMQNRLTWVAMAKDGIWKIVHQHTSAPINPDTMRASLRP